MTFSRNCSERFEAVTEPYVSNCVHAGSRYIPSARSGRTAVWVGYGSTTTSRSSVSIAFFISGPRVWLLGAWPHMNIALIGAFCATFSADSSTPSIQRDTVMPFEYITGTGVSPPP